MQRIFVVLFTVYAVLFTCVPVYAGVMETINGAWSWITGEALAYLITGALALVAGAWGGYALVKKSLGEIAEFVTTLDAALKDDKLSREELASIAKEGKDIFAAWKKPNA